MVRLPNIVSRSDRLPFIFLSILTAAIALAGVPLRAQDRNAPPRLEDLIPDSAVENPGDWASQGTQSSQSASHQPEIDAGTPIADTPDDKIAWPTELSLPSLEKPENSEDIQYADLKVSGPQLRYSEAPTDRISSELVLAFPQKEPPFSQRGDFVSRFSALSTIKHLHSNSDNSAQLGARAKEDEKLLENLLKVYGYYGGQVIRSIGGSRPGEDRAEQSPLVRFDVIPGTRYRYGSVNLGQLMTAPGGSELRKAFKIFPGDYLQSDTIVEERADLDTALGETGYPFAAIEDPQLLIDHERETGDLTMVVKPNGKYAFGDIVSADPKFLSNRHLADIARFRPGDIYKRSLEFDLRRAVIATGLVSSVAVTPREITPPQNGQPGVVAMDVSMRRARLRTISGAVGYGSEDGFKVEAAWEHRNFFPPEGLLRVRTILGTKEQLGGVTVRWNNFHGRDRVLSFDAYAQTQDNIAYKSRTIALTADFERVSNLLFQKPFSWALGAQILGTDEGNQDLRGVPEPTRRYLIVGVHGRGTIDTTDSLLDPTHGFRLTGFLAPEGSFTQGRQFFYLRNQADFSYYRSIGDKLILAGRSRLASIPGAPLDAIAPSRRLYAGGGASVRGYGYEAIGPKDINGNPTGGRSLFEVSGEARIRTGLFGGKVSVVPFVDAGTVSTGTLPNFQTVKVGAGLGVRYATGFGPLRVDVGFPLNPEPTDSFVAVYVSLGQAF